MINICTIMIPGHHEQYEDHEVLAEDSSIYSRSLQLRSGFEVEVNRSKSRKASPRKAHETGIVN